MPTVEGLYTPGGTPLGDRITKELSSPQWNQVKVAVAFLKMSGVSRLYANLDNFGKRTKSTNGYISFIIGIDHGGTSLEAVDTIHQLTTKYGGHLWIVHNPQGSPHPTYHPKMWLFSSNESSDRLLLVGSGNLTQGGLYTNYEAGLAVLAAATDTVISETENFFNTMMNPSLGDVTQCTTPLLTALHNSGQLPSEIELNRINMASNSLRRSTQHSKAHTPHFPGRNLHATSPRPAPNLPRPSITIRAPAAMVPRSRISSKLAPLHDAFYIMVSMKNKTEVFLAKQPLTTDPAFFGAPFRGLTTPRSPQGLPQPQADPPPLVRIVLHTSPPHTVPSHPLKMWTYTYGSSANDDFRTNFTKPIQDQIPDNSIVVFERDPDGTNSHLQFAIDIYPPTHPDYPIHQQMCSIKLPNSNRFYGWR